jgi:hypothetical protein
VSTPEDRAGTPETAATPIVSTAPAGAAPPPRSRWRWSAVPDHLGRARTSTVVLCVLFLAIGLLYLNVRPDPESVGTSPAGDRGQVEAPVQPSEPEPSEPEPVAPTTTSEPEPTEAPDEEPATPTTTRPSGPSTPTSTPAAPTEEATEPTETSVPTGRATGSSEPAPPSVPAP